MSTVSFAGALKTGAWFVPPVPPVTMMSKPSVTETPREVAVTVAWWVPVLPAGGETAIVVFTDPVPVPGGFRVANDGSDAVRVIKAPLLAL